MKKEKKREKAVKITEKSNVEFDKLQVMTSGRVYQTLLTKKYKSRTQWAKPDPQQIKSIIPGTVTEITVKIGDSVKKGDRIIHDITIPLVLDIGLPISAEERAHGTKKKGC